MTEKNYRSVRQDSKRQESARQDTYRYDRQASNQHSYQGSRRRGSNYQVSSEQDFDQRVSQNHTRQSPDRQNPSHQGYNRQNPNQRSYQDPDQYARQYSSQYSRDRYQAQSKRSPLPFIIIVVVILLAIAAFFVVRGCLNSSNSSSNTSQDIAAQNSNTPSTTQAPDGRIVMTICGSQKTILKRGEKYVESGCIARDSVQGNISESVQISGNVDENTAGTYTITYTATNSENMTNETTREVEVVDDYEWDTDGISVMMYHYVYPDDAPPEKSDANFLSASKFEAQLQWLTQENYYYPSFKELRAFVNGEHSLPAKSVILTFDDGDSSLFEIVKPLAEKYKVPVTSFIIGNRDNVANLVKENASPYVDYESHSYAMHEDGTQNIGRGGAIYDFSAEDVARDCEQEREIIGNFNAFAYPYGDISDIAPDALAQNGVETAFSIVYGQVHPGDDPMRLKRMRVFGESSLSGYQYQVEKGPES